MAEILSIEEFLLKAKDIPVIDVRSPAEFENGHIPGAFNIPIFSNDERAIVGINYKNNGKENAILNGLEIVGPKLASFVKEANKITKNKKILVHCWRGGMRSSSMAWLFKTAGYQVDILEGGYKNYRNYSRGLFEKIDKLLVLGGFTGSGKTDILKEMEKLGVQFLDLEGIANHKGSAFGAIGQHPQPTSEQFENDLAKKLDDFDLKKPVWVEDESRQVGKCAIPDNLYAHMRNTKLIKIIVPKEIREKRLVKEYGCFPKEPLETSIKNIERRLGGLRTKQSLDALAEGNLLKVAEITLEYYDKAYLHGNSKRDNKLIESLDIADDNPPETAKEILDFCSKLSIC
ncbi:MAG: tRNA 2-selenouridine(34) synthase MnmH [Marinilabiliales bacterium]|nr:MAG: tRNA 2-selenouridine(34) synthase MnmH [Marinilabiliales bacterium]